MIEYPQDCSYFEYMSRVAEISDDPIEKANAERELQWMVDENNKALEEERMATVPVNALESVNIRRLTEYLQETIRSTIEGHFLEPNDRLTQKMIQAQVESFLSDVQSRRLINLFEVICDDSNNPEQVIENNELVCDVFIQPITMYGVSDEVLHLKGRAHPGLIMSFDDDLLDDDLLDDDLLDPTHQQKASAPKSPGTIGGGSMRVGSSGGFTMNGNPAGPGAASYSLASSQAQYGNVNLQKVESIDVKIEQDHSRSEKLPTIIFKSFDDTQNQIVYLQLDPEPSITASDSLKIARLIHAYNTDRYSFSVIAFVRANSLERHFRFTT